MKHDLSDVTFTIPVRYDTDDRIHNISLIVDYLRHNFDTTIIVMEEAKEEKFSFLKDKVNYHFIQTEDPNLHRTRCLNNMAKMVTTPFIANYDTDVLFTVDNYTESANILRSSQAQMVFPYDGRFLECPRHHFDSIRETFCIDHINQNELGCNHPNSVGGCIFWHKDIFFRIGMENENFKSWGWEDNERIERAKKLGVGIKRTGGHLLHLSHQRLSDSTPNNSHYSNNAREYHKVQSMTRPQLESYVSSWSWIK